MTDDRVATLVDTPAGRLAFQDYFVARRQADDVLGVTFEGVERAQASPLRPRRAGGRRADRAWTVEPNRQHRADPGAARRALSLTLASAPVVAVSPIVGGKALKGPADRMLATLGHEVSAVGVAALYADFATRS